MKDPRFFRYGLLAAVTLPALSHHGEGHLFEIPEPEFPVRSAQPTAALASVPTSIDWRRLRGFTA